MMQRPATPVAMLAAFCFPNFPYAPDARRYCFLVVSDDAIAGAGRRSRLSPWRVQGEVP
ncbi:hypothetical protein CBM2587_A160208 [Cupriavidus taiwanensis]|uniref:Uncharacterized protein n=1 Tax=Cupriavidus taiwanensis TaxID=164546 RepID=A0A375BJ07_9BURK|nr:hypothetical protein CBM2587_A160208 [Cupriavidus taiwanensis]